MEISIMIARIVGVVYFSFGIGLVLDASYYQEAIPKLVEEKAPLIIAGFITAVLGATVVTTHNLWVSDWRLVITLLGWTALAGGVSILALPRRIIRVVPIYTAENVILYLRPLVLVLGMTFLYLGFVLQP